MTQSIDIRSIVDSLHARGVEEVTVVYHDKGCVMNYQGIRAEHFGEAKPLLGVRGEGYYSEIFRAPKKASAASDLKYYMEQLHESGAVIVLPNGDELALTPEAIDAHLSNEAERAGLAADEAYYGGDSPGSYGPDDPGPQGR